MQLEVEGQYVTTPDFGRHSWGEGPIRHLNWFERKQEQIKKINDDYDRGEYEEAKRCRPCGKYYYGGEGLKNHLSGEKHKKQLEYLKSLEPKQEEEDEWKVVMTRKGRKAKNEADRDRAKQEKANAARAKSRGNAQAKPAKPAKPGRRRNESESESEDSESDDEVFRCICLTDRCRRKSILSFSRQRKWLEPTSKSMLAEITATRGREVKRKVHNEREIAGPSRSKSTAPKILHRKEKFIVFEK